MERQKLASPGPSSKGGGAYFSPATSLTRFTSGCTLLDCALGGGWVIGQFENIVGDKSTGKTLLTIEAAANYKRIVGGDIYWNPREPSFDVDYSYRMGLPRDTKILENIHTVEQQFKHLEKVLDRGRPAMEVIDSLDALTDQTEMDRELGEKTYGLSKPKLLSDAFRKMAKKLENSQVTVFVISQVRDDIGATFGRKTTRSGGRALDFYACHVIYLAHIGKLKKTLSGVSRAYGIQIKAMCDKNKAGNPFREVEFPILFNYGIDDLVACMDWLAEVGKLSWVEDDLTKNKLGLWLKHAAQAPDEEYHRLCKRAVKAAKLAWEEIERKFAPRRRKYE